MNRRCLLKLGAGGAVTTAVAQPQRTPDRTREAGRSEPFRFVLDPSYIGRYEVSTNQISDISPVVLPIEAEPYLQTYLANYRPSTEEAKAWIESHSGCCESNQGAGLLDVKSRFLLLGSAPAADLLLAASQQAAPGNQTRELALEFYPTIAPGTSISAHAGSLGVHLSAVSQRNSGREAARLPVGENIFKSPLLRVYFKYPDDHPLRPCVSVDVKHVGFEIFAYPDWDWRTFSWSSGGTRISSLHAGYFYNPEQNGYCAVLFDSVRPWFCMTTCDTFARARQAVQSQIVAALVMLGIAAWLAAEIATVLAPLVLLVLAV